MQIYVTKEYNRTNAVNYAHEWALSRNPLFYNYTESGGDCTSFVSQCVLAGSCVMNFTPTFGWYYISDTERTASWTGVEFFYNFMTQNNAIGPYGTIVSPNAVQTGDVVQLGDRSGTFYHSLLITGRTNRTFLVTAHTNDVRDRALNTYNYYRVRFIHILGVRLQIDVPDDCYDNLINGIALP